MVESGRIVEQVMPFSFQMPDNSWWQLPIEPLVSVSMENIIVKRNVAKSTQRGTIKERWAEGDVKITIEGTFINELLSVYPAAEIDTLRQAITNRKQIAIQNELLQLLNVHYIVVESCKLPFTKGENTQNYSIEAVSDDSYKLFIEVE